MEFLIFEMNDCFDLPIFILKANFFLRSMQFSFTIEAVFSVGTMGPRDKIVQRQTHMISFFKKKKRTINFNNK